eukprot:snap_masked-scaffold192_size271026-processed-gene-1.16 protein:Tk07208 transcript:snap_masked-scaffold192_size271026-processed-gene-1.16-mRNA-1 annotation:"hypothetical protein SINV_08647"
MKQIRINDGQLLGLAEKARYDARLSGYLYKRSSDNSKWLLRWFRLYQCTEFPFITNAIGLTGRPLTGASGT